MWEHPYALFPCHNIEERPSHTNCSLLVAILVLMQIIFLLWDQSDITLTVLRTCWTWSGRGCWRSRWHICERRFIKEILDDTFVSDDIFVNDDSSKRFFAACLCLSLMNPVRIDTHYTQESTAVKQGYASSCRQSRRDLDQAMCSTHSDVLNTNINNIITYEYQ